MKAYLSTFSDAAEAKGKPLQPQQCCENYCIPGLRPDFGMIQQERQNNIINILGGHSYAM